MPHVKGRYQFDEDNVAFVEGYGGWAFDRYGGNGPAVGGRYVRQLTEDWETEVRADTGLFVGDTDSNFVAAHTHLKRRF